MSIELNDEWRSSREPLKLRQHTLTLLLAITSLSTMAAEPLQEVIISASPHQRSVDQIAGNVSALNGNNLAKANRSSLGATLAGQVGINNSSFGPASGHPVIRGQSGKRLAILNNSMASSDASALSSDHANALDTLMVDRIEVIRGPATLRYGPGAIGGVINLIDNRIHPQPIAEIEGALDMRYASNGDLGSLAGRLDGGNGRHTLHLDGAHSNSNDLEIPGRADNDNLQQPTGTLENSAYDMSSLGFGYSFHRVDTLWGFSANSLNQRYGIPGEHLHLGDEHHDDEHDEHDDEERVEITLQRTTLNGRWRYDHDGSLWQQFSSDMQYSDYRHTEWGVSEEARNNEARFDIEQFNWRSEALYQHSAQHQGAVGIQLERKDSAVVAEQPITPDSTADSGGIFWLGEWQLSDLRIELGSRLDWQRIEAEGFSKRTDNTLFNSSAAVIYDSGESGWSSPIVAVRIDRSERAPTVEELYSDGYHAATSAVELGSSELDSERALSGEFNARWAWQTDYDRTVEFEATLYRNEFSRFTYLSALTDDSGWQRFSIDSESCSTALSDFDDSIEHFEEAPLCYQYDQQPATFQGIELELAVPIAKHHQLVLQADRVRAKLDDGYAVPRVPADSATLSWQSNYDQWAWNAAVERVKSQNRAGRAESNTRGYTALSLGVNYQWQQFDWGLSIDNLTDKEIRNASSAIRDLAPESGRTVMLSLRYTID